MGACTKWRKRDLRFRARVREIYATALAELILENNFEIVQPSRVTEL